MDWFERLQKRKELRDKIKKLQKEVRELQEVISDYHTCQRDIDSQCSSWETSYQAYTGLELYPSIWKKDQFEGQSAEELSRLIPEAILEIQLMSNLMKNVSAEIGNQVTSIEDYIEKLTTQISGLQEQLAAYE